LTQEGERRKGAYQCGQTCRHNAAADLDDVPGKGYGQRVCHVVGGIVQVDAEAVDASEDDVAPQQEDDHEQYPLQEIGLEPQDVRQRQAEDDNVAEDTRD
jgi:hypothetical protein